jgi:hypothetical protein
MDQPIGNPVGFKIAPDQLGMRRIVLNQQNHD